MGGLFFVQQQRVGVDAVRTRGEKVFCRSGIVDCEAEGGKAVVFGDGDELRLPLRKTERDALDTLLRTEGGDFGRCRPLECGYRQKV